MEKKNLAIIILVVVLAFSAVGNVILGTVLSFFQFEEHGVYLKVARLTNPFTMDSIDSWDSASNSMLDQVVETLVAYDLTDPDLPIIGRLAESWHWTDNKTIFAWLFWLVAFFVLLKNPKNRLWTVIAMLVLFAMYMIPHSMGGSELDNETGKIETGIRE